MTTFKQIEANRRNALKSRGPTSAKGKQSSRCNAVRHGLTAETVIGALEDAEDYKAFELPSSRIMMRNRRWSGSLCCGWPVCFGGCAAPPQWKRACSKSRLNTCVSSGRSVTLERILRALTIRFPAGSTDRL